MGQVSDSNTPQKHNPILNSQALWDATMAYSISGNLNKNKNALIVHLNGAFHTESHLGTVEHLLKYSTKTKVLVVTIRYEDDFKNFRQIETHRPRRFRDFDRCETTSKPKISFKFKVSSQ